MSGRKKSVWLLKRVLSLVLSLLVLSVIVFAVSRFAPGDPLRSYYGDRVEKMSTAERAQAEEKLGLHEPLPAQYFKWLQNALHGDFGLSYKYKMPVTEVVVGRIGSTVLLGGVGFVLLFFLALLLGVFCVRYENKLPDRALCRLGTVTSCIPEFWLALVLILIFSVTLRVLPSAGAYSVGKSGDTLDRLQHLILPLTVVVLSHLWYYAYMVRNMLAEEVRRDYVRLAKAKGLDTAKILLFHCLPNALPAFFSLMAVSVPHILGGTYIVEAVFSYPGLGTLAYESARYKDYNLLMFLCLLSGAVVMVCGLLAQLLNARLDPRLAETETEVHV